MGAEATRRLRTRVKALLEATDANLDGGLNEATPLIISGKLDSQGLFNLALFIEKEIGRPIDVSAFDLAKEWNTIDDIVEFIVGQRAAGRTR
ncbi:MAG TPA: acyl carrier protein [Steroidobacteraceae bacterium]|jgi:acyl carrier protein|nr:acyl carrier protein [Steroidobacteraceae bacterium]